MTARSFSALYIVLALLPGAVIWEIVGRLELTRMLPPLSEVFKTGIEVWTSERFLSSLRDSMTALFVGLLVAVVLGVVLGLLMARYDPVDWSLGIFVNTLQGSPKAALVPVIVLFFGIDRTAIVATIVLYAVFPVLVNTMTGVRTTSGELLDMAHSFGASERQKFAHIILPHSLPLILGGVKFAASRGVKGLVIGEQLIAVVGLGALIQRYSASFQVSQLYAMVLFVGLLSLVTSWLVSLLERAIPVTRYAAAEAEHMSAE